MLAPAKINLDLRIIGRRDDGYHLLDSIVVFTDFGDELLAEKSDELSLTISGPYASDLNNNEDNLILKTAKLIGEECNIEPKIKFHLIKNLPVSSGIGGGSADAAAAIKLTLQTLKLNISHERLDRIALSLGADVPVCLRSSATHMRGIGECLKPINIDKAMNILLVNPGVSVSTPEIFQEYKNLNDSFDDLRKYKIGHVHYRFIKKEVFNSRNALEEAACMLEPKIKQVLKTLAKLDGLLLNRMSGSGATCFAVFDSEENCIRAEKYIKAINSKWWVEVGKIV